jgi:hypothetical protein
MSARLIAGIALVSAALNPYPALAKARPIAEEAQIARCIRSAAAGHDWLEKTLWGLREQEAGWLGAEVANTNGTHDLGPLQINSWWVPRIARLLGKPEYQVRYWLRNDACFNAQAARWIFLSGLAVTGDYWKAVGAYHSPTPWRQQAYTAKVASHMRRLFGARLFAVRASGAAPCSPLATAASLPSSRSSHNVSKSGVNDMISIRLTDDLDTHLHAIARARGLSKKSVRARCAAPGRRGRRRRRLAPAILARASVNDAPGELACLSRRP